MSDVTYTKTIRLPSHKAGIYANPIYSGDIVINMIGVKEESATYGNYNDTVLSDLINKCVVSPEGFDVDDLLPNDRHFMLVELRIHSYGDSYHEEGECPFCGNKEEHKFSISDDITVFELSEDYVEPVEVKLPVSKVTVGVRALRQKEINQIMKVAKANSRKFNKTIKEVEFMERLKKKIVTMNGEEATKDKVEKFVSTMTSQDRIYLEEALNKEQLGYDVLASVSCSTCGETYEVPFRLKYEFFRPRYDV